MSVPTNTFLPGPHKSGYNRPKTDGDMLAQMLYLVLGVAALLFCLANGYWFGVVGVVVGVGSWLMFLEWMSRCEDRTKVRWALAIIWAFIAAMEIRHQLEHRQSRERIAANRRTPTPGVWNPLDYGDR